MLMNENWQKSRNNPDQSARTINTYDNDINDDDTDNVEGDQQNPLLYTSDRRQSKTLLSIDERRSNYH